jgi:hypothetical protein
MGQPLDSILKKELIGARSASGTIGYETINTDGSSDTADSSRSEGGFSLGIVYENGVGNNVEFFLEASIDGEYFSQIPGTEQTITDASGNIIWEIVNSGTNYVRIAWTVAAGTMDIYGQYSAKRRH